MGVSATHYLFLDRSTLTWSYGDPMDLLGFGERLRAVRLGRGKRQEDVATALGVTAHTVANWERERTEPSLAMLAALCRLLRVSADMLLALPFSYIPGAVAADPTPRCVHCDGWIMMGRCLSCYEPRTPAKPEDV